ncbi:MAG TPA: hypothetical protein ENH94_00360 [Phycisphaerales bacterium]|nr:hypothetical protein [Phycisphaerales bacterium]
MENKAICKQFSRQGAPRRALLLCLLALTGCNTWLVPVPIGPYSTTSYQATARAFLATATRLGEALRRSLLPTPRRVALTSDGCRPQSIDYYDSSGYLGTGQFDGSGNMYFYPSQLPPGRGGTQVLPP